MKKKLEDISKEFDYSKKVKENYGKFWHERYPQTMELYAQFCLEKYKELEKLLQGGERLLDIGTGFGDCLYLYQNLYSEIYGVDPSKEMIDIARFNLKERGVKNGKVQLNIAEKMDFPDAYFDDILMLDVFEHLHPENIEDVLKEIHRVSKNRSKAYIITPSINKIKFWCYLDNFLEKFLFGKKIKLSQMPVKNHTEIFYRKKEVLKIFEKDDLFELHLFKLVTFYPAPECPGAFHKIWSYARKTKITSKIIKAVFQIMSKFPPLKQKMLFVFIVRK